MIRKADYSFKDNTDPFFKQKWKAFIKQYGIPQIVVVAEVDGVATVVDGNELIDDYDDEMVWTINLGKMSRQQYIFARLFLTARTVRLNYLEIAKAISEVCKNEADCLRAANNTTISYDDIKNYQNLLTFDWEAFLKAPINESQIKLFEDER